MKVLLSHNFYQSSSPSGEDVVFNAERELLKANGVEVITYERWNDDILKFPSYKKLTLPFGLFWSKVTYNELKQLIKKEKPDIAHFHNIFYLISPSAYYACKDAGIPVIQTLHNFRFFCVSGLLMRDGKVCEECVGKLPWRGVVYGCYKDSRLYSIPIALMEGIHRFIGTWRNKIDAYIALTEFCKKKFVECGLPKEKIFIKPNFLLNPPEPDFSDYGYAIFLGRLSQEKGVDVILEALKILNPGNYRNFKVKIVGDGPMRKTLEDKAVLEKMGNIEFTGRMDFNNCIKLLKRSKFMIMPAKWYEGFPMTIRESFACGKAVIASRLGSMAEIVEDGKTGLLFEPDNPEDLVEKIKWMIENEDACIKMGKNARRVFEEKYTAERNLEILMKIYHSVLEKNR